MWQLGDINQWYKMITSWGSWWVESMHGQGSFKRENALFQVGYKQIIILWSNKDPDNKSLLGLFITWLTPIIISGRLRF